jgi:hypothetical protein
MPNTSLRSALDSLAQSFSAAVLDAIRGASLDELVGETNGAPRRGPVRPRGSSAKAPPPATRASTRAAPKAKSHGGRLARRTPEEIADTLASIVALVKSKKTGLRSEQIREALKLDRREMPRVLQEGLAKKALKSKGQKRATTYSAAA